MISINVEKERVGEGVDKAVAARDSLTNILQLAGDATDMINQIACATEEQSATTDEISTKIHHVSQAATTVHSQLESNDVTFQELAEVAEKIFTTVGKFSVGNYHDDMKGYVSSCATGRQRSGGVAGRRKITMEGVRPNLLPSQYLTAKVHHRLRPALRPAHLAIQEQGAGKEQQHVICHMC